MKSKFDPKSAVLGAIGAVLIVSACGAMQTNIPTEGPFQIETSRHHAFVLDTKTGQVWEKFLSDDKGSTSDDFSRSKLNHPRGIAE